MVNLARSVTTVICPICKEYTIVQDDDRDEKIICDRCGNEIPNPLYKHNGKKHENQRTRQSR